MEQKAGLSSHSILISLVLLFFCQISCTEKNPAEPDNPLPVHDAFLEVPAEYPTIKAALAAAIDGDEIILSDGIYTGTGNTDIVISGKSVTIRSLNGPEFTVIDCSGDSAEHHQAFIVDGHDTDNSLVQGLTIRNGYFASGAAIYFKSSSPLVSNCVFENNIATVSGGAIRCKDSSPRFENCTFVGNSSGTGGAIFSLASSAPVFERCIIAFSDSGQSIVASGAILPQLLCCNVYGNVGGDWPSAIAGQAATNGNFSANPLFCDEPNGLYKIQPGSPCAPQNNTCGALIGAFPVGCAR